MPSCLPPHHPSPAPVGGNKARRHRRPLVVAQGSARPARDLGAGGSPKPPSTRPTWSRSHASEQSREPCPQSLSYKGGDRDQGRSLFCATCMGTAGVLCSGPPKARSSTWWWGVGQRSRGGGGGCFQSLSPTDRAPPPSPAESLSQVVEVYSELPAWGGGPTSLGLRAPGDTITAPVSSSVPLQQAWGPYLSL